MQEITAKERVFTVELKSKRNLKNLTLTNGNIDTVFLEGTLGELVAATFAEGVILEVIGEKGTLRLDLREDEIQRKQHQNPSEANAQ